MRRRLVGRDAGIGQDLSGKRITIVGDVLHSRVARSNVDLLHTLGAEVTLVAPPTLAPVGVESWPCEISYDLDSTLSKSDAVMMLRVQRERMNAAFFPTEREYSRRYGLDGDRMAKTPQHAIVMHPGPMVAAWRSPPRSPTPTAAPSSSRSRTASRSAWPCSTCSWAATSPPSPTPVPRRSKNMSKILIRGAKVSGASRRTY